MKNLLAHCVILLLTISGILVSGCGPGPSAIPVTSPPATVPGNAAQADGQKISLPQPRLKSDVSLEEALSKRRSIRQYADTPMQLEDVSQLLWAAQGVTDTKGGRTAPSAVASYPLEVYLVAAKVNDLAAGIYLYSPPDHELLMIKAGDQRDALGSQGSIKSAAIDIVIAANYDKTRRFGENSAKWAYLEAGHAAQNVCLEATALGLGTVTVGGFTEDQVIKALGLTGNKGVLYVLPVGKRPG